MLSSRRFIALLFTFRLRSIAQWELILSVVWDRGQDSFFFYLYGYVINRDPCFEKNFIL